jgi:aryl-alcohol dehydrogenase-like predicted oxidoreductase
MRYKILGQHTGLRVSELVLGTGMFGTNWGHGADRDESRRMFDGYVEADGNFLDTSDSYQFGKSDSMLDEFIDPKGSLSVTGNSRKAMVRSLEQSLIRLGTDRIDLYWVHARQHDADRRDRPRSGRSRTLRQGSLCRAVGLPGLAYLSGGNARGAARLDADNRTADQL